MLHGPDGEDETWSLTRRCASADGEKDDSVGIGAT